MLAKLRTYALVGIDAVAVETEVDAAGGTPKTILVGLPEMAVRESIHRIERALVNLGYHRHGGRTVINLAPAGWTFRKSASVVTSRVRGSPVTGRNSTLSRVDRGIVSALLRRSRQT